MNLPTPSNQVDVRKIVICVVVFLLFFGFAANSFFVRELAAAPPEFSEAVSKYVQGNDQQAKKILRKILARNPDHDRARNLFEELGGDLSALDSPEVSSEDSVSRSISPEPASTESGTSETEGTEPIIDRTQQEHQPGASASPVEEPLQTESKQPEQEQAATAGTTTLAEIKPSAESELPADTEFSPLPEAKRQQASPQPESVEVDPQNEKKFINRDYESPASGERAVHGITAQQFEDKVRLKISGSGSLSYITSHIFNPPMLIIDIPNSVDRLPVSPLPVNFHNVVRIRHSQYRINPINTTRVVIDLEKWTDNYKISRVSPEGKLVLDIYKQGMKVPAEAEPEGVAEGEAEAQPGTSAKDSATETESEMTLRKVSGKNQEVQIQQEGEIPLSVSLSDPDGEAVTGEKVLYEVLRGDGVVDAQPDSPGRQKETETNEQGFARARFLAGKMAGPNIVEAYVPKYNLSLKYRINVTPGQPARIIKVSGDRQQAQLGREVPKPLVVEVQDTHGNPVPGVRVQFEEKSGRGLLDVDLETQGIQRTARTGKDGRVKVDSYQISSSHRDNQVVARVLRPNESDLETTFKIKGHPQLLSVDFKQANLQDVLRTLAEIAGWDIALSEEAQGVPLQEMQVTVHLNNVTALKALDTILDIKGLARVTDGSIMKIVSKQRAVQKGVPVITPDQLKNYPGNNMVTVTYKLRFLQAGGDLSSKLRDALMAPESSIIADESSNALVITDLVNNQRRINQVINQIDRPDQLFEVRVFDLEYRDAEKLAQKIKSLLPTGQGNVVPNKSTRSLLIFADPNLMNKVEKLVKRLDSSGALVDNFQVVKLEGYDVTQIAQQVNAVLGLQTLPLEQILNFDVDIEDPEDLNQMLKEGRSIDIESLLSSASVIPLESVDRVMIFGPKDIQETALKMIDQLKRESGEYLRKRSWRWITIHNLPLSEAKSVINRLGGITIQTQLPVSNALLLSADNDKKLDQLEDFLNRVDRDVSFEDNREIIIYSPQYVDPSQLGSDLESYYEELRSARQTEAGGGSGGGGASSAPPRVLYQGDNQLVLVVAPSEAGFVRRLLNKLDSNLTDNQAVLTYSPKHLEPSDLSSELDDKNIGTLMYEGDYRISLLVPAGRKQEILDLIKKIDSPEYTTQVVYLEHTRAAEIVKSLQTIQENMDLNVTFSADQVTNSIIFSAPKSAHEQVRNIISKLDRWQKQVYIEGIILEYTMDEGSQLGSQLAATTQENQASISGGGNLGDVASGEAGARFSGEGLTAILNSDNFKLVFDALASKANSEILAKPLITAINNEEASIRVGDEQQIEVSRQTSEGVVTSLESVSAFTELRVTPTITANRYIRMDLMISSDDFTAPQAANVQTQTTRRTTQNSVLVKDGQTVVIGGLIQEQESTSEQGVPLLKNIPYLGYLFKSYQSTTNKRELVVFLTPHVIESPAEARRQTEGVSDELRQITPMPVNLNISRVDQIARLRGLSPEKDKESIRRQRAQRIVEYREARGPFRSLNEVREVPGMNEEILNSIAYKVAVQVNLNTVSMDDLLRLRGIEVDSARAIINLREQRQIFESLSPVREILLDHGMDPAFYDNYLRPVFNISTGKGASTDSSGEDKGGVESSEEAKEDGKEAGGETGSEREALPDLDGFNSGGQD